MPWARVQTGTWRLPLTIERGRNSIACLEAKDISTVLFPIAEACISSGGGDRISGFLACKLGRGGDRLRRAGI